MGNLAPAIMAISPKRCSTRKTEVGTSGSAQRAGISMKKRGIISTSAGQLGQRCCRAAHVLPQAFRGAGWPSGSRTRAARLFSSVPSAPSCWREYDDIPLPKLPSRAARLLPLLAFVANRLASVGASWSHPRPL